MFSREPDQNRTVLVNLELVGFENFHFLPFMSIRHVLDVSGSETVFIYRDFLDRKIRQFSAFKEAYFRCREAAQKLFCPPEAFVIQPKYACALSIWACVVEKSAEIWFVGASVGGRMIWRLCCELVVNQRSLWLLRTSHKV